MRFGLWSKLNAWADRRFYDPVMNWLIKDIPAEHLLSSGSWPRSPKFQASRRMQMLHGLRANGDKAGVKTAARECIEYERRHALPITMTKGFLGSVAEALEWCEDYETALEVREEMWMTAQIRHGPESAEAIIAMEWVAVDARNLGDYERATSLLRGALAHRRVSDGPSGKKTLATQMILGEVRLYLSDFEEATALYQDVLMRMAEDDPRRRLVLFQLGRARLRLGDFDAATELQQEALAFQVAQFGREDRATLRERQRLAVAHWYTRRLAVARDILSDVLLAQERLFGSDDPDTVQTQGYLDRVRNEMSGGV